MWVITTFGVIPPSGYSKLTNGLAGRRVPIALAVVPAFLVSVLLMVGGIAMWSGESCERPERKIKLTTPHGRFLFYLPFPKAEALTVVEIMQNVGVEAALTAEILDLVQLLEKYGVIESLPDGQV